LIKSNSAIIASGTTVLLFIGSYVTLCITEVKMTGSLSDITGPDDDDHYFNSASEIDLLNKNHFHLGTTGGYFFLKRTR
jgi:hypothetical protein